MSGPGRKLALAVVAGITVAYPLLVWLGIGRIEPVWLALLLVGLAVLRALAARERFWWFAAAGALLLAVVAMLGNQLLPLKLYPVLVNSVLLIVFGLSLLRPPTAIERIARMHEPNLPESGVRYTRRVTEVWCGFFLINGAIALYTALYASEATWVLYNGLIAYLLMGVLFAGEYLLRRRVRGATA